MSPGAGAETKPEPPRGLVDAIARSWRDPRGVMAAQVAAGLSEPRALMHLMLACLLVFVARLPAAVRSAGALPVEDGVSAAVSAHLFGWIAVAPLLGYGLAALIHLLARAFGGRGGFLAARAALFWSALATCPAILAIGLADALGVALTGGGAVPGLAWFGLAAAGLWAWIFAASLAEAEGFGSTGRVAAAVVLVLGALLALAEAAIPSVGAR
ncbi:MAG TPA: YIP1 family protein [Amaricoccus sp.]|nr:YIP1 family protein [Amaricoccus sp.]